MSSLKELRPGDLAFGPMHGAVGLGVGTAQFALATIEPGLIWRQGWREWWGKRHCGIVTPGGRLVQAMPGGAEEIELRPETHWTPEWTFIRPAYTEKFGGTFGIDVAHAARGYVGTPYDFLTYPAIPLYRAGVRGRRIEHIISGTDTMMCSRLLDASLAATGYHLFDDGRMPGNVTPSEAYRQLRRRPGHYLLPATGYAPGKWLEL